MGSVLNQRVEARYNCTVPVEGKEGREFERTKTLDISRHGIGFLSSQPIAINQKIALEIVLKQNTEPVMVIGVVKWVRKIEVSDQYRVGMVFSEIISGSSSRLDRYFSSKRSEDSSF
jgi:c-di-GMP-binding flagellar brake protein YcgR